MYHGGLMEVSNIIYAARNAASIFKETLKKERENRDGETNHRLRNVQNLIKSKNLRRKRDHHERGTLENCKELDVEMKLI